MRRALLSKTDLTITEIDRLAPAEGWALLYAGRDSRRKAKLFEVCFSGFGSSERDELEAEASSRGLKVVTSVTKQLAVLVAGNNAGPTKLKKAQDQGVRIMNSAEFRAFLETGSLL